MNRSPLSLTSPAVLTLAVLSLSALPACGSKGGDDDDTTGGTGGTMTGGGGTTSMGGTGGSAGGTMRPEPTFDFDTDEEGWKPEYISLGKDDAMMDVPSIDLMDVKATWADGVGDGDMGGALQGTIPYTSPRQYVGFGINLSFEDFTDKLITMRLKVKSGIVSDADIAAKTPGAKIYVKTGDQYVYAAGVYGGYFGAAQGILLLGMLGVALPQSLQRTNALKNILTAIVNGVAGVYFAFAAHVAWTPALIIAGASIVGGQLGAHYGRRLHPAVLRGVIVIVGVTAIVRLLAT